MIDWYEVKAVSVAPELSKKVIGYLSRVWPGGVIEPSSHEYDLLGADFIAGHPLFDRKYYIDLKYRRYNPKYASDSFAVEWWSKLPRPGQQGQLGWSMGQSGKLTTHILYIFEGNGVDSAYLLDFSEMKKLVAANVFTWRSKYGSHVNQTSTKSGATWFSEVSFIPPEEFAHAIINRF